MGTAEEQIPEIKEKINQLRTKLEKGDDDGDNRKSMTEALDAAQSALKDLQKEYAKSRVAVPELIGVLQSKVQDIYNVAIKLRKEEDIPIRSFLSQIVGDFEKLDSRPETKLGRIVRQILNQEMLKMNLVLFFDALDEFDGHPDVICRFIKGLVQGSARSKTKVKICLSSRPWKALQDHFSAYPQIALEMHTKVDIEDYVTGSVKGWRSTMPFVNQLVSAILTRANGVFLWVRLAVGVLSRSLKPDGNPATLEQLETQLSQLPNDLSEFYQLIIERIGRSNRHRTFALLELLARRNPNVPPPTAAQIREAVLVSECTDFQDAEEILKAAHAANTAEQARIDLATWGGGLVEIGKRDRPELMHQTVLEFILGLDLDFKKIVLGDRAEFVSENGHSFHAKYWASRKNWENLSWSFAKRNLSIRSRASKHLYFDSETVGAKEVHQLAYHGERAEDTTGKSQFGYFDSLATLHHPGSDDMALLFLLFAIVGGGLKLGTRDWIARNPGELERLTRSSSDLEFPLFSSTFFAPVLSGFYTGHIKIFRMLLENGFHISADRHFFPLTCAALWDSEFRKGPGVIHQSTLLEAAALILKHGQDANAKVELEVFDDCADNLNSTFINVSALHIGLPALAEQVLQYGGDPDCLDERDRTALDWLLDFPSYMVKPKAWNCQRRYDMCKILIGAGGSISPHARKKACLESMAEFEGEGYDTGLFHERLEVKERNGASGSASPAWATKRKRVDSFESWYSATTGD